MTVLSNPGPVDAACAAAAAAAASWAASDAPARAGLLRALADALETQRADLVPLADHETSLGIERLNGELERTTFQLRMFASLVEQGAPWKVLDESAAPGAPPAGRPRMQRVRRPLGPVAMFSASNFPFAFSVLGGDTASALAAGCSVVVKAHPGHPQLSRAVHAVAALVLQRLGLLAGVLQLVDGEGLDIGVALVRDPRMAAVAFTGSLQGGHALWREANGRPRPIPFFGELGSVNPVVALAPALRRDGVALAEMLAGSIALGAGQFCTRPGLVLVPDAAEFDGFIEALAIALRGKSMHRMLTEGIRRGFDAGAVRWATVPGVRVLTPCASRDGAPAATLGEVSAQVFLTEPSLREEVFGPASLVVRVASADETIDVLRAVGGSLTVTLWGADEPDGDTCRIVSTAEAIAGRVLFAGVPTGVAVCAAQQHGGPWPSSTAPQTTSVGHSALDRFLRPVALQDAPAWLSAREGRPC